MSIESGGTTATMNEERMKEEKSIIDEELEDGELDSDDDEPIQPAKEQKSNNKEQKNQTKSSTTSSSTTNSKQSNNNNKHQDDKSSNKFQSHKQQTIRKRIRRSGSEESEDLDSNKRSRKSNRNTKQPNNRNKRPIASTDDESESDNEDLPKIDQKMMFTMLKQMQDFFVNNNDKSNKHNKQEYDKFFERVKNNKSGQKEMMKFFKKNEKMMNNQSSHENNLPAMFNLAFNNPAFFSQGPPNAGMNMFNGLQPPPLGQQYQQQMNPILPGNNNFPFNGPPQFGGPCFNNPQGPPGLLPPPNQMQQQQFGSLNDLPLHNSPGLMPQSSMNSTSNTQNNKKQKKRKKMKEEKEDLDEISNKQVCKYYLEGFCHKGNDCDFLHQQPYNYKKEVCKFYLQDSCHKGDNCTFLHKEFPCKFFHTGQDCTFGENCKFSHEPMNEELKEIFINYLDNADLNEELNVAYGLSKNTQKKAPILGNVPEDVKGSYQTWVWQQEMRKLELAYTGTKRNLFCIDDIFVLKEKPPRDSSYDDDEDEEEYANFNKDIDERQSNFYFDTHGDLDDEEEDYDNLINQENPFTKDNDLRKEFAMNENSAVNLKSEMKSLDEVKKEWLDNESEEELEQQQPDKEDENNKKSSIDITKMLDVIRQTTNSQNDNQASTTANSSNNSEFWKTILNGVNLDDSEKTDQDERSSSFSFTQSKPTTSQQKNSSPRDPRLLRQRHSQTKQHQSSSSIQKILADEPFTWSHGDVDFKLYKIDVDKIDYSVYRQAFEIDCKLKNDPRLQNYFNNQQTNKSTNLSSNLNPTDVILAPLTLSQKNETSPTSKLTKITIPPAPSSKLSALDLISPSTKPQTPTNQLSFEEQILASVHISKEPTISSLTTGGLTSLADLVKSKKINSSDTTDN